MKTRHGKIARLPKEIREQLNRRLENGWRGARQVKARGRLQVSDRIKVMKTNNVKITPWAIGL